MAERDLPETQRRCQIDHREEALMLDLSASPVLHLARSEHNRRRFRLRPQARAP